MRHDPPGKTMPRPVRLGDLTTDLLHRAIECVADALVSDIWCACRILPDGQPIPGTMDGMEAPHILGRLDILRAAERQGIRPAAALASHPWLAEVIDGRIDLRAPATAEDEG